MTLPESEEESELDDEFMQQFRARYDEAEIKKFLEAHSVDGVFKANTVINDACSDQEFLMAVYCVIYAVERNYVIDILGKCNSSQLDSLSSIFGSNVGNAIANSSAGINRANDFILGINLSEAPGWAWTWALIIPISAFLFQFLSMKVAPVQSSGDPQQDQQMKSMRRFLMIMQAILILRRMTDARTSAVKST